MLNQKIKTILNKGLPTALLEVALIFVGITLAIAFENWNTEREERRDEIQLLAELKSNLEENLQILNKMIAYNESTVVSYNRVLSHIRERKPYSNELAPHFARLDNWGSPYLSSSAYETLKGRGLDLISDGALRRQIVNLFDVDYVALVNDYDRSEWINYEVSTVPMVLRHFEELSDDVVVPVDYDELLSDISFIVAVKRTIGLRKDGISGLKRSAQATSQVINSISEAF